MSRPSSSSPNHFGTISVAPDPNVANFFTPQELKSDLVSLLEDAGATLNTVKEPKQFILNKVQCSELVERLSVISGGLPQMIAKAKPLKLKGEQQTLAVSGALMLRQAVDGARAVIELYSGKQAMKMLSMGLNHSLFRSVHSQLNMGLANLTVVHAWFGSLAYTSAMLQQSTSKDEPDLKRLVENLEDGNLKTSLLPLLIEEEAMDAPFVPLSSDPDQILHIPTKDLEIKGELGTGGFATVYVGSWKKQLVAIKQFKEAKSEEQVALLLQEARMLVHLEHPNVLAVFGVSHDTSPMLITEYIRGRTLSDFLYASDSRVFSGSPPWCVAVKMMISIVQGMLHLHENHIAHLDLKSMNVMVTPEWEIKIIDFGISRFATASTIGTTSKAPMSPQEAKKLWATPEGKKEIARRIQARAEGIGSGTIYWMDPESFVTVPTLASDIYSLGIIFTEFVRGSLPYIELAKEFNHKMLERKIEGGLRPDISDFPSDYPPEFKKLIERCLHGKRKKRPTIREVLTTLWKLDGSPGYSLNAVIGTTKKAHWIRVTETPIKIATQELEAQLEKAKQRALDQKRIAELEKQALKDAREEDRKAMERRMQEAREREEKAREEAREAERQLEEEKNRQASTFAQVPHSSPSTSGGISMLELLALSNFGSGGYYNGGLTGFDTYDYSPSANIGDWQVGPRGGVRRWNPAYNGGRGGWQYQR